MRRVDRFRIVRVGADELEGGGALIQVYTGNGKGKTTAALGLVLRASGAGLRVYFCQFLKGRDCSELVSLKKFRNVKIKRFGSNCFIRSKPDKKDFALAKRGLKAAGEALRNKKFDVVILDEINVALRLGLLKLNDVVYLIKQAPPERELILTGRYAHPRVIRMADLVSVIQERKHYFKKGVRARRGIEY